MPSRRKLIEQVVGRYALNGEALSAGTTSAHVSAVIDRLSYQSMYIHLQQIGATGVNTGHYTTVVVYDDNSSAGLTVSAFNTANFSISSTFTISTSQTVGKFVDLAGAERYLKLYITPSAALSNTVTVSLAAILGDRTSMDEPAT